MVEHSLEAFLELLGNHFDVSAAHEDEEVTSLELAKSYFQEDHDKVVGMLKSLESKGMVYLTMKHYTVWVCTEEGVDYAREGSPEFRVWQCVKNSQTMPASGTSLADIKDSIGPSAEFGVKIALKNKWVGVKKGDAQLYIVVESLVDTTQQQLQFIEKAERAETNYLLQLLPNVDGRVNPNILQDLKRRKLVSDKTVKYYVIKKGPEFAFHVKRPVTDLTSDMLITESWRDAEFKPYNFFAGGRRASRGSIHPLVRMANKFKKILISMGFSEMPTNLWVESSFWNFDTLFMPQQHPARDIQDTFFLLDPKTANLSRYPQAYVDNVHKIHQYGGHGSFGWNYPWSRFEASKNILRTHTTATSARMLFNMALEYKKTGILESKRMFSIDRVFRNETLDATHLAEFHQVEGLVAEKGIGLADLMGIMRTFYAQIGLTDIRFKPAYNPYTEPSMEIFGFHPKLQRWIEVGNSGVFRPELLLPMGLSPELSVIAWGLSLERPTMIRYNVNNIRELFGPKASLNLVYR